MHANWRYGKRATLGLLLATLALPFTFAFSARAAVVPRLDASQDLVAPVLPAHTTLPTAIAFLERSLTLRMNALTSLSSKVAAAKSLPTADRVALVAELTSTTDAIATLQAKAPAEATVAAASADLSAMVLDYHVLTFVGPQVRAVLSTEVELAKASRLLGQEAAISAAIAAASQAHENVARERTLMATFQSRLTAMSAAVAGLPAALLALQPSSIPGSIPTLDAAALADTRADVDATAASTAEARIVTLLATPSGHLSEAVTKALRKA